MTALPKRANLLRRCKLMRKGLTHTAVHRHQQLGLLRLRQGRKHWGRDDFNLAKDYAV